MAKNISSTRETLKEKDIIKDIEINGYVPFISGGNEKLGNIPNFNITAGDLPFIRSDGKALADFAGSCKGYCSSCEGGCYARRNEVRFPFVQRVNAYNYLFAKHFPNEFKSKMIQEIENLNCLVFRIHESGEMFSSEYFETWLEIIKKLKNVVFYMYTHNYDIIRVYKKEILKLKNLTLNISTDLGNYERVLEEFPEFNIFVWDDSNCKYSKLEKSPIKLHCPATSFTGNLTGKKCINCGLCFHKKNKKPVVIACYDHSKQAKKI